MLRQLSHPNVVGLKEVIRDATHVYIVQECLTGGELFDRLLAKGPFKEDYALTIFAQVRGGKWRVGERGGGWVGESGGWLSG
jgi:5'-AMP-activated protein kinase catalytic alpha subunit